MEKDDVLIVALLALIGFSFIPKKKATSTPSRPATGAAWNERNLGNISWNSYQKASSSYNNNIGNILHTINGKHTGPWKGEVGKAQNNTVIFDSLQNGIRAAIANLYWYYTSYLPGMGKKWNIYDIISTWCPPSACDTQLYIAVVAKLTGLNPNTVRTWDKEFVFGLLRAKGIMEQSKDFLSDRNVFERAWSDFNANKSKR